MNKGLLKGNKRGVGLVEVVIASAILTIVLFAFTSALSLYSQASANATKRAQALYLTEEALEVVRGFRDAGWAANIESVEVDAPLGISFNSATSEWTLVSSPEIVGEFTRTITFRDVYRDANDNIAVGTGGTYDGSARRIEAEVTWIDHNGNQSLRLESILTNAFE